jgi:hypothetical protein
MNKSEFKKVYSLVRHAVRSGGLSASSVKWWYGEPQEVSRKAIYLAEKCLDKRNMDLK